MKELLVSIVGVTGDVLLLVLAPRLGLTWWAVAAAAALISATIAIASRNSAAWREIQPW